MATKSVIQIEVQDGEFKSFTDRFNKYRDTLAKMPAQWGAVGKAIGGGSNAAAKFVAQTSAIAKQFKAAESFAGKLSVALKTADRLATSLGRGSLTFARNIKDATSSLLKWGSLTGLISGLLGAGGLFGISRLAQNVSSGQQSARETGSTYGETKAANVAYGQLLGGEGGVASVLAKINEARQSFGMLGDKPLFGMVGMRPDQWQGKSSAEILPQYLEAVQSMFKKQTAATGGQGQAMIAKNIGLADVLDVGKLTALSQTNLAELARLAESTKKQVELSQGTQNAWANFERVLGAAGEKMENSFIRALNPLIPALTDLSNAAVRAMRTILDSPIMKGWIAKAGRGLEDVAKWLTSPNFGEAVSGFLDAVDKIGGALWGAAEWMGKVFGGDDLTMTQRKKIAAAEKLSKPFGEAFKSEEVAEAAGDSRGRFKSELQMAAMLNAMRPEQARPLAQQMAGESIVSRELLRAITGLSNNVQHLGFSKGKDGGYLINGTGADIVRQSAAAGGH